MSWVSRLLRSPAGVWVKPGIAIGSRISGCREAGAWVPPQALIRNTVKPRYSGTVELFCTSFDRVGLVRLEIHKLPRN